MCLFFLCYEYNLSGVARPRHKSGRARVGSVYSLNEAVSYCICTAESSKALERVAHGSRGTFFFSCFCVFHSPRGHFCAILSCPPLAFPRGKSLFSSFGLLSFLEGWAQTRYVFMFPVFRTFVFTRAPIFLCGMLYFFPFPLALFTIFAWIVRAPLHFVFSPRSRILM